MGISPLKIFPSIILRAPKGLAFFQSMDVLWVIDLNNHAVNVSLELAIAHV